MKHFFLSLALLTITFSISAQETPEKESKFMFGVNFSGNYSYRVLLPNEEGWTGGIFSTEYVINARNNLDTPRLSFNAGITAQYLLSKRFEISLDAQYTSVGYSVKDVPLTSVSNPEGLGLVSIDYRYNYLQIPVRLNYKLVYKRTHIYFTGGIAPSLFIDQKVRLATEYNDGTSETNIEKGQLSDINNLTLTTVFGVGVGFHLLDNIILRVEPIARYSLTPIAEAPIKEYHYSLGCQFQVSLKL